MARAKHTVRAEARRRYRQASSQPGDEEGAELDGEAPKAAAVATKPSQSRPNQAPSGRPGFFASFRSAYHPARIREDIPHFAKLLTSWAFLAGIALVVAGAAIYLLFPKMSGGQLAWDLLVVPASALAPSLVVGFFAPRASYFIGFVVGTVQAIVYALVLPTYAGVLVQFGATVTPQQIDSLRVSGLMWGPLSGLFLASASAWYRRFLSLSSPKRTATGKGSSGRAPAKPAASKRAGR